ncbi:hypothetical protein D7Y05_08150 [bacterium 1XD42-54]|nr:hypothetical protein D7Y05_08150 [bacterium 1XD42-54]
MEYAITFADVMTGLIGIGLGVFGWLVKNWISGVLKSNEETKVQVKGIDKKIDERIKALDEKTDQEIRQMEKEITDFKSDFATMFVLREDYFRAMNKMEESIRNIDHKIDRLLLKGSGKE